MPISTAQVSYTAQVRTLDNDYRWVSVATGKSQQTLALAEAERRIFAYRLGAWMVADVL